MIYKEIMALIDEIEAAAIEEQGEIALDGLLRILALVEAKARKARLRGWLYLLEAQARAIKQEAAKTTYTEIPALQPDESLL